MRVTTWNVNSIRARETIVLDWIRRNQPDVLLLQETKVADAQFPRLEFEAAGYGAALHGQGDGRHGVAILARQPIEDVVSGLPGADEHGHARWIEATVGGVRVASVYVPNGTALDSPYFPYKLAFLGRMEQRIAELLADDVDLLVGGDMNVAPEDIDVYDPVECAGEICFHPAERQALRRILHRGAYDVFRARAPTDPGFTWWHYQGGAWERDAGLRIDLMLGSGRVLDRVTRCTPDRKEREGRGVSDHVPLSCELTERA